MNFTSKCPCGAELSARIKKPTRFQFTTATTICKACESEFFLTCEVDRNEPGRVYKHHFEILDLSEKACEALKPKAPDVAPIP